MNCLLIRAAALLVPTAFGTFMLTEPAALPDTPAGACVRAFFDMIAEPTDENVRRFESEHRSPRRLAERSMESRVSRAAELRARLGKLSLKEVISVDPNAIVVVANGKDGPVRLEFEFDASADGKLDAIQVIIGEPQHSGPPVALTPEVRAATVEGAADAVEKGYVYPEIGQKMAAALRDKLKAGAYEQAKDEPAFARMLTQDLRAVSNDRHLGVRPAPRTDQPDRGPSAQEIAGDDYGFRKVEILPENIGYVRFDAFMNAPQAETTAAAALAFVAHCDALIFDLRENGGGDPAMIRFMTSFLFDEPTHLNDMVDRDGKVVEEFWTLKSVPGRRFATGLPVFVLTSSYTFSGAEEFRYNLQNLKRATIVGETTGGGAHPVRGERINLRFMIGVPYMRARNPISQTKREGTGVKPDVGVSASQALERAVELATKAIHDRRSGSDTTK